MTQAQQVKKCTPAQTARMYILMVDEALKFGDDPNVAIDYNPGWCDARVQEVIGCPKTSPATMRKDSFGLKHPKYGRETVTRKSQMAKRVEYLEKQVAYLISRVDSPFDGRFQPQLELGIPAPTCETAQTIKENA